MASLVSRYARLVEELACLSSGLWASSGQRGTAPHSETYTASVIVGLAAQQADRPDLIRSPKRVLAHLWREEAEL